jgi:amino acid permease
MSQDAWEIFCENLEAEQPKALFGKFCPAFAFLGFFLITIMIFANSYSNFEQYGANADPPVGPFVIVPVLFVAFVGGTMCFKAALEYQVRGNLQRICEDESKKYWNLSSTSKRRSFTRMTQMVQ